MSTLIFFYGLFIGSFLGVCISRIPEEKSVIRPRSHCEACGRTLKFIDMIPIVSYLISKGRCRYCGDKLSLQYPIIELLTACIYVIIYKVYGFNISSVYYMIFSSLLIIITFIDFKHMIIPNGLILTGIILIILYNLLFYIFTSLDMNNMFVYSANLRDSLLGGLIGYGVFFIIVVVTGAMGGGDVRLMGILGLAFGIKGIAFIAIGSFIIGAIISVILMITKIKGWKDMIPFGPFISITALIYILYGNEIIINYLALFAG